MTLRDFMNTDKNSIVKEPVQTSSILVVEDEPFIAMDVDDTLRAEGFLPEVRSSRTDALNWLDAHSPAAAVLDLHLRDGDGLAIAEILRARRIPVIICSGGQPADIPENFKVAAWVPKPFAVGDLVAAVRQALEMREFHQDMEDRA